MKRTQLRHVLATVARVAMILVLAGLQPASFAVDIAPSDPKAPLDSRRIGLQIGHWQHDSGAVCPDGVREVNINYAIGQKTADLLHGRGFTVDLLPSDMQSGYQADAFLAIHSDYCASNPSATGFKAARAADSTLPGIEDRFVAAIYQEYAAATGLPTNAAITNEMLYYYGFYRVTASTPAAIIELGYISNDRGILLYGQDRAANGLANALQSFLDASSPPSCTGPVKFYEDAYYNVNHPDNGSICYSNDGTYTLPTDWRTSSLTLEWGSMAVLYSGLNTNSPCIQFDTNVDDFTKYYFSDGTNVNDRVRLASIWVNLNMCLWVCGRSALSPAIEAPLVTDSSSGVCGGVPRCPGPSLNSPGNGYVTTSRTVSFEWDDVNCSHSGFTFRVKTVSNMDSGGETVVDTGEGGTSRTVTFDSHWDNKDLYWSVRAANAASGADWSPARQFRISPNAPPAISFNSANGSATSQITSRDRNWTFIGTA